MNETLIMGTLTGLVFGTVLYKVAAIRYARVLGMLLFADSKIMKFAFTAIGTAAFGYGLADIMGVASTTHLVPRVLSYTGWAHVLGGVIFGVSMAVTGLCPGTAVCRAGANTGAVKFEALSAVLGLFIGIAIFSVIKAPLFELGILGVPQALTLHGVLGLPYGPVALAVGTFFVLVAALLDRFRPEPSAPADRPSQTLLGRLRGEWHWLPSGIIAGLTIMWATSQGGYIGYSGSVLAIYGWAADAIGLPTALVPRISDAILWRASLLVGVGLGAFAAHQWSRSYRWTPPQDGTPAKLDIRGNLGAIGGGTGLALGAMIGGGCTTGAFMAAFPTLSLGSFAMGGTFFAAAVVTALVMNRLGPLRLFGASAAVDGQA